MFQLTLRPLPEDPDGARTTYEREVSTCEAAASPNKTHVQFPFGDSLKGLGCLYRAL